MYKPEAKEAILKELNNFFNVDRGNRITMYNMAGLFSRINGIFDENIEPPKPPKKEK